MAGSRVNTFDTSTCDLTDVMMTLGDLRRGFMQATITKSTVGGVSDAIIRNGSIIDVAGTLYKFSSDEPASTASMPSTDKGCFFVVLSPTSSQCSVEWSTSFPTYREDYCGWYNSTVGIKRYVAAVFNDVGSLASLQDPILLSNCRTRLSSKYEHIATMISSGTMGAASSFLQMDLNMYSSYGSARLINIRSIGSSANVDFIGESTVGTGYQIFYQYSLSTFSDSFVIARSTNLSAVDYISYLAYRVLI